MNTLSVTFGFSFIINFGFFAIVVFLKITLSSSNTLFFLIHVLLLFVSTDKLSHHQFLNLAYFFVLTALGL